MLNTLPGVNFNQVSLESLSEDRGRCRGNGRVGGQTYVTVMCVVTATDGNEGGAAGDYEETDGDNSGKN